MRQTYLIGVDLGTSGTKAALFDASGRLIADAFAETPLHYPKPGWVEQDPEDFYRGALETIRTCLEKAKIEPGKVAALAFSGQMAGICSIDAAWQTPTRYDSWLDSRCAPYMQAMRAHQQRIIELTGGYPTYSHGPKILWWLREQPEAARRIAKFVMPAAYVAGRLAGLKADDAFIDTSYLHFTCLSDTAAARWSDELCEHFGVPQDKLPRIVRPWEIIGHLTPEAAHATGLLAGTPIAAGAGDTVAGMLGAGLVEPGMALDVAGTASVFAICLDAFKPDTTAQTLFTGKLMLDELYFAYAYINGGGLNLRWFRDTWQGKSYQALEAEAAAAPPGSDGLFFLPHLGGRVCPNDPAQRGLWSGFSWSHGKGHFYRALLEGVAYEYAHYLRIEQALFPELAFQEVRVIGGGAASPLWNQIKADVLALPYITLSQQECTVLGAALIAGRAAGIFGDLKEAARRCNQATGRTEPREALHACYRLRVDAYLELLERATPHFARLTTLPEPPV